MDRYKIEGGHKLNGSINVHGAKNAALPCLAAAVINGAENVIHNCPDLSDIRSTIEILSLLGCKVTRRGDTVVVDSSDLKPCYIPSEIMNKTRSSAIFAGALAARCKAARISKSGGCQIGKRPIDIHLDAFKTMGMKVAEDDGSICIDARDAQPCNIILKFPSVGATENIMIASSLTEGVTNIYNAAKEPEISNLASFLRSMGVSVLGDGSEHISIKGTKTPGRGEVSVIPDRIVAATYLIAALACGGKLTIGTIMPRHLSPVIAIVRKMGADIVIKKDSLVVKGGMGLKNIPYVQTQPYPGFPTDVQPMLCALMSFSAGKAIVRESIFENRFGHCLRLQRFGADIDIKKSFACINGVKDLNAAEVDACDLRCGAALCIAALKAQGTSIISQTHYIDRGYVDLCTALSSIGAKIERIE